MGRGGGTDAGCSRGNRRGREMRAMLWEVDEVESDICPNDEPEA